MAFSTDSKPIRTKHKLTKIGIPSLDEKIRGLPTNSIILLLGDPGSGFDTFLHQILHSRSASGARVLYVSLDRSKEEIEYDLSIYNWSSDNWEFLDLSPGAEREKSSGMSWSIDSTNLVSHDLIRRLNEEKIKARSQTMHSEIRLDSAINSITPLLLNSESDRHVLSFLDEYARAIRDTNGFHFITLLRGVHGEQIERLLSHFADVVIEMLSTIQGNEYVKVLGIKKMRGIASPPSGLFNLEFTEKGVLPVTTTRVR